MLCPPPQRSPFDVGVLALARERERGTRERMTPEDALGGPGGPQHSQAQLLPAGKRSLAGSDVPRASVMAQLLRWVPAVRRRNGNGNGQPARARLAVMAQLRRRECRMGAGRVKTGCRVPAKVGLLGD